MRGRLLKKLERYGITGVENKWFQSYLRNRTQSTQFQEIVSSPLLNNIGLPQGSKLSADLFSLFINDITDVISECAIGLFADDTLLYTSASTLQEAADKMNKQLERVLGWLNINKLKLNTDKTKAIIFNANDIEIEDGLIKIDDISIEIVKSKKHLGFMIDYKMNLHDHIDYICKKIAKKIGFLARISKNLNFMDRITVYKSIIAPHFEYCASVLYTCTQGDIEKLQLLQNRAMRIILRCNRWTSIGRMLEALCWLNVKQRITYKALTMVFKLKHNMVPVSMTEKISIVGQVQPYPLRNINDFQLHITTKSSTMNIIFHKGVIEFNKLPVDIKSETNYNKFKGLLLKHIKDKFK